MTWRISLGQLIVCETAWAPMAQAAWHRVTRNREAEKAGTPAEIYRGEELLSRVIPVSGRGHRWPDGSVPECGLRDVFKALLQLLRRDEWTAKELADALTDNGLPTSRARIDALRGSTKSHRAEVSEAEIVVLIDAVTRSYE